MLLSEFVDLYKNKYGANAALNAAEMRKEAAFLEGMSMPDPGAAMRPIQKRYRAWSVSLTRAARLVEALETRGYKL